MPSATEAGALLGLAFQIYTNSLRKRISTRSTSIYSPYNGTFLFNLSTPFKYVVAMTVGAVIANQIVEWDNKAQQLKQADYQARLAEGSQQANNSDPPL